LDLPTPLVASSSPLSEKLDNIKKMEEAGAGAVVLHSLFEEQLISESRELDRYLTEGAESFPEALTYFPEMESYGLGPEQYLEHIAKAKDDVDIPIIGSLNGVSAGAWIEYAESIEEAGADALEINVYYLPTQPSLTAEEVEGMYVDLVSEVKKNLSIPLAVKLGPFFSSIPNLARRLDEAGAEGLVMFNRFYQPDIDVEGLKVTPNLVLSTSGELRLRLRWVAILYGRVQADLAVTGGVHSWEDALKSLMAGAKVTMMASALLERGIGHLGVVLSGIQQWMDSKGYDSIEEIIDILSQRSVKDPAAFERANYIRTLKSYGWEE